MDWAPESLPPGLAEAVLQSGIAPDAITETKLKQEAGAPLDCFGRSVTASGDTALAGAFLADIGGILSQGAAYAYAPGIVPTVSLVLNAGSFNTGGAMSLRAIVEPADFPANADVWVRLTPPAGPARYLTLGGTLTPTPSPIVGSWPVAAFNGPVFSHTFAGGEPAGAYAWDAALTEPGTLIFIGPVSSTPFTFTP